MRMSGCCAFRRRYCCIMGVCGAADMPPALLPNARAGSDPAVSSKARGLGWNSRASAGSYGVMASVNWIVVADAVSAHIFAADAQAKAIDEIADLVSPSVEQFPKQLSSYLDSARSEHRYERIYLIASP